MLCVCVCSQVLLTRLQVPALMMTTAGIWTRIKSENKSNSFFHREDTTALGSSSTPCSLRCTSSLLLFYSSGQMITQANRSSIENIIYDLFASKMATSKVSTHFQLLDVNMHKMTLFDEPLNKIQQKRQIDFVKLQPPVSTTHYWILNCLTTSYPLRLDVFTNQVHILLTGVWSGWFLWLYTQIIPVSSRSLLNRFRGTTSLKLLHYLLSCCLYAETKQFGTELLHQILYPRHFVAAYLLKCTNLILNIKIFFVASILSRKASYNFLQPEWYQLSQDIPMGMWCFLPGVVEIGSFFYLFITHSLFCAQGEKATYHSVPFVSNSLNTGISLSELFAMTLL